jgi:hypothetical protein
MSATNTVSTLDGLFKVVYGPGEVNLLPDFAIISRKVPFQASEKIGEDYRIPVKLQYEHGFTYGASGDGAFTLNASVAGVIKKAQVNSTQIVERSQMDYEAAFKASSAGKQAFQDATQALVENMSESFAKRLETAFLYGGTGLGKISSSTTDGSNKILVLTDATWAGGIWTGMVNCPLDCYNSSSKINSNAVLVIVSVNIANKSITVSGNVTDLGNLAAGYDLYFTGAYGKELNGIDKLLTNSGSLYGIDAATYELWRSTSYDCAGAITMAKVLTGASRATVLGLKEDVIVLLSPASWTDLNNELAATRRTDGSYSGMKIESGTEGITYYGVNGKMEIIAHPMVKDGEGFILPMKRMKRVGSTDITFSRPGNKNSFFRELENSAGFELRAFADQQLFLEAPGMAVKLTGITH